MTSETINVISNEVAIVVSPYGKPCQVFCKLDNSEINMGKSEFNYIINVLYEALRESLKHFVDSDEIFIVSAANEDMLMLIEEVNSAKKVDFENEFPNPRKEIKENYEEALNFGLVLANRWRNGARETVLDECADDWRLITATMNNLKGFHLEEFVKYLTKRVFL